jgi:hypothetical protein
MVGPLWVLRITVPLGHWVRLIKPEEVGLASAARWSRRAAAVVVDLLVMSPVLFVVFRAFGHSTTTVTSAGTTHTYFLGLPGLVVTASWSSRTTRCSKGCSDGRSASA